MNIATVLLTFVLSAAAVVAAGTLLARGGDVIAARTRLGGLWVGAVFLAFATSLPEIATDVVAVRMGLPDLAAGDLFGSSMANMLILALISLLPAGAGLFRKAAMDHALYASLAIVLTCIAAATIMVRPSTTFIGFGPGSLTLLLVYIAGSRVAFLHSATVQKAGVTIEMSDAGRDAAPDGTGDRHATHSLKNGLVSFGIGSLVVLLAAPVFAESAGKLADITGLGPTFIGTWLLGLSTSLPELVTSIAAVRLRSYDLAVGNLFGSNALNMTIFVVLDAVHTGGPVLSAVDQAHALSAFMAIMLMAVAIASLVYRAQGWRHLREPASALMIALYIAGILLVLFRSGT